MLMLAPVADVHDTATCQEPVAARTLRLALAMLAADRRSPLTPAERLALAAWLASEAPLTWAVWARWAPRLVRYLCRERRALLPVVEAAAQQYAALAAEAAVPF
jgi:hypothetical protein